MINNITSYFKQDGTPTVEGIRLFRGIQSAGGGVGGPVAWDDVTSKPATFPPSPHGHVIGDVTGLQASLDGKQAAGTYVVPADLAPYVLDANVRGGAENLAQRLSTISNFASPNAGGVIVGQYYDNAFHGTASGTLAGAANRVDLAPFYTSVPLPINQLGVAVSTAVAASLLRCFIYASDANGWPSTLLYEGDSNLSGAAAGFVSHSLSFTFASGRQYWVGVRSSSTTTIRAVPIASAVNLGLNGAAGGNYFTGLRRTLAFATPLPESWGFLPGDRVANVLPPSIRFRAA